MKNININCPINGTGYGTTSLNIVKALSQDKHLKLSLFPIGGNLEVNSENDKELINTLLKNSDNFDYNAPCIKIWHQFDLATRVGNGHYYSSPAFEIDKLTPREQRHLNYCDFIFIPSHWGKQILQNNNIHKPIYVVPLGVDNSIFSPKIRIRVQKQNYTFFHIGKWEHRKSHDFLINAFSNAFSIHDNVELHLLPFNPFLNEQENQYWLSMVNSSPLKDKIKVFNRLPTHYHLAEFIDNSDCGVFLSRAEGWNNEIIECMAMDKPIIATNYSGHTEYLTEKNSFMVNVTNTEPANDGKWFNGFGNWAKLGQEQFDQTIQLMRYVYSNNIKSNPNGIETAQKYSWSNTANIISQILLINNSYYANTKTKSKRKR